MLLDLDSQQLIPTDPLIGFSGSSLPLKWCFVRHGHPCLHEKEQPDYDSVVVSLIWECCIIAQATAVIVDECLTVYLPLSDCKVMRHFQCGNKELSACFRIQLMNEATNEIWTVVAAHPVRIKEH